MSEIQVSQSILGRARDDLKLLLDRGYRRDSSLDFVGDHHNLGRGARNRLLRETHSQEEIADTRSKLRSIGGIQGEKVAVDGFNVLITVEAGLCGGEVFMCQDGMLRDNVAAFSNYKVGDGTRNAADAVLKLLSDCGPSDVTWVFDSQISSSGRLAEYVRGGMGVVGLKGESTTCPNADYRLLRLDVITATSDTTLIKQLHSVVDLPSAVLEGSKAPEGDANAGGGGAV